jgi:hypothetical protein
MHPRAGVHSLREHLLRLPARRLENNCVAAFLGGTAFNPSDAVAGGGDAGLGEGDGGGEDEVGGDGGGPRAERKGRGGHGGGCFRGGKGQYSLSRLIEVFSHSLH